MEITKPKRESEADPFASGAPDARPVAKPRDKKKLFAMTLPPDLMEAVDPVAAREDRSRAKMVEILLRRAAPEAERAA